MANDDGKFERWQDIVNTTLDQLVGLGIDDIDDMPYYRWFEEGVPAGQAALAAIHYAEEGYCPDFASAYFD